MSIILICEICGEPGKSYIDENPITRNIKNGETVSTMWVLPRRYILCDKCKMEKEL